MPLAWNPAVHSVQSFCSMQRTQRIPTTSAALSVLTLWWGVRESWLVCQYFLDTLECFAISNIYTKKIQNGKKTIYILLHIMVEYLVQNIICLVLNCRDNMTCVKDNSCLLRCHFVRGGNFVVIPRG